MASVTVNLTGYEEDTTSGRIFWPDDVNLGSTFASDGSVHFALDRTQLYYTGNFIGRVNLDSGELKIGTSPLHLRRLAASSLRPAMARPSK